MPWLETRAEYRGVCISAKYRSREKRYFFATRTDRNILALTRILLRFDEDEGNAIDVTQFNAHMRISSKGVNTASAEPYRQIEIMENTALRHREGNERRLELVWVDLTVGDRGKEPPSLLADNFIVRAVSGESLDDSAVDAWSPAAVCCDYDYPDQRSLERLVWLKGRLPTVPVFAMTVQHSETLAVWTFRAGAIDYLVKPAPKQDLLRLIDRIRTIDAAKRHQAARNPHQSVEALPDALPRAPKGLREKLAPAVFYVKRNFSQRITSDPVARMCGLSPTHFSRAFREVYGVTFQDFILRVRTTEACKQLRAPGAAVTGVAYAVGFTDASYFARVFKRYIGRSPSDYVASADDAGAIAATSDSASDSLSSSQIVRSLGALTG